MRRFHTLLLLIVGLVMLMSGCDSITIYNPPNPFDQSNVGWIRGRVCDPSGASWLEDSLVYVNLADDRGHIYAYRYTYTDRDGWFVLEDIPQTPDLQVFATQNGQVVAEWTIDVLAQRVTEIEQPTCIDPLRLDVAVVTGDYDEVDTLLTNLGFADFTLIDGISNQDTIDFLSDEELLTTFDMVFFNGGFTEDGIIDDEVLLENIRRYIESGGTVIASDWAYDLVESLFPNKLTFVGDDTLVDDAQRGRPGVVECQMVDPNLANVIGSNQVDVEFDLPLWPPVLFGDPSVSIHVTGNVQYLDPTTGGVTEAIGSPVLVSFAYGAGQVVFSSFRIEANDQEEALRIQRYMLFSI